MIYTDTKCLFSDFRKVMKTENVTINELSNRLGKSQPATSGLLRMNNISLNSLLELTNAINYDLEINFIKRGENE